MRLDRFVSQAAGLSRSQARNLIRRGRVSVDGRPTRDPASKVDGAARVECTDTVLSLPQPQYLMMNKPCGLLCATSDDEQATVMTLLPRALATRLHPVGRLDKETSGLLLLTDDGAWSHRVTSPRHHCAKTYLAELAEPLVAEAEQRLLQGLVLHNEQKPTQPAKLQRLGACRARITITEGRYHQVRRMFAALGNRVVALHRERIGGLVLDGGLEAGHWRALSAGERTAVLSPGDRLV